jgi:proton-translocating NADH-quinone oxidoreductase chain M
MIISIIIGLPIIGLVGSLIIPVRKRLVYITVNVILNLILLINTSCLLVYVYGNRINPFNFLQYDYLVEANIINDYNPIIFGIDPISLIMIILTVGTMTVCFAYQIETAFIMLRTHTILLYLIEIFLVLLFLSVDIFWFYVFFESLIIPFFLLINIFGYRNRRNHAAYLFIIYTIIGSVFILYGLLLLYRLTGTTDLRVLRHIDSNESAERIIWLLFFIGLGFKVPIIPAHVWLPEAHVEAPTTGSVVLAALVLKISCYGYLRFLRLFPETCIYFEPLVVCLCLTSFIWSAIVCLRQIDLKKIIAYSSIVHMNFALLGILLWTREGLTGGLISIISHGLVSSALFLMAGMLFDRYNTRNIFYLGGLCKLMPLLASFFFITSLANCGFPGTIGFVGELLIMLGLPAKSIIYTIIALIGLVFPTIYSIWTFDKIFNGPLRMGDDECTFIITHDLSLVEETILLILLIVVIRFGIIPGYLLGIVQSVAVGLSIY